MGRKCVRWAAFCAAILLLLAGAWIGYRVFGYSNDKRLLDQLATAEPSLGYDSASWAAPDLCHLGVTQDSLLLRPSIWGVVHPVFSRVTSVSFRGITDADLERCRAVIERFSRPIELCLVSDKITDSGLETIARFKNLNGLALYSSDARITDAGVARLRALSTLEMLCLDNHALTDQCVVEISRFPRLQRLTLSGVPVSASALEMLGQMKTLKALDLRNADVSRDAMDKMAAFQDAHAALNIMY